MARLAEKLQNTEQLRDGVCVHIDRNVRLFGRDCYVSNDMYQTQLNNNDLIVGPSGAGKTRGYVLPLIRQMCGSMIVSDTKNALYRSCEQELRDNGYRVYQVDFRSPTGSCAYNPLDYISRDDRTGRYSDKDIMALAYMLCPTRLDEREPYWTSTARTMLESMIAYVLETTEPEEHHLGSVTELYMHFEEKCFRRLFEELREDSPESFAVSRYDEYKAIMTVDKTFRCLKNQLTPIIAQFNFAEAKDMFSRRSDFDFAELGREKSVVFVNISDVDRSMDGIANIFFAQAFRVLEEAADCEEEGRLPIPVRIIMDDFATNMTIPNFDKIISVIRSREISTSIIIQSLEQLESLYSKTQAATIINNCDHLMYLGGADLGTCRYISEKMDVPLKAVLGMGLDECILFERGDKRIGRYIQKNYGMNETSPVK